MRYVLIDESNTPPYAIPFSDEAAALAKFKELVDDADDCETIGDAENISGDVVIADENPDGLWTGYSSSDRGLIFGDLPLDEDEDFIGNGDPRFYFTANVPDGEQVPAVESVIGDNTHPLYQAWLNAQEAHEDENDGIDED